MESRGVYDDRLSESVSVAWKSLERAFLQDRQKALLQVQCLKEEVARLQAELQQARKDPNTTLQYDKQHESQTSTPGMYERLHRIHNLTKVQAGQYKGAYEKCKTRLHQSKAGEAYWRRLAEQNGLEVADLRRRIQHTGNRAPSQSAWQHLSLSPIFNFEIHSDLGESGISAPSVVLTDSKTLPLQRHELAAVGKLATSLQESQNDSPNDEDLVVLENVAALNKGSSNVIQDSSQATLSELGEDFRPLITKPWSDESDEEPTIISSRVVRKRAMSEALDENHTQKAIKLQSGNADASSEIRSKQEEDDRRFCTTIGVQVSNFVQDEDFDLDEVSGHVDTPKKLLRFKKVPEPEAPKRLGLGLSGRIERPRGKATSMPLQANLLEPPTGNHFEEEKSEEFQQQQRRNNQGPDQSGEKPQSLIKREGGEETVDLHDYSETSGEAILQDVVTPRPRSALKPLSTNRPVSGLPSGLSGKGHRRRGDTDKGIVSIAEDGSKSFWSDCETPRGSKRVQQLLERSNPKQTILSSNDKTGNQPPQQRQRRPQRQTPASECRRSFAEIPPSDEPLRARPLSRLSLDDFRINPLVNQGHSYAFNEVIRGRAQRRACLTGCTLPECCGGQFRKMLQLSNPALKSKGNTDDLTGGKSDGRDDLTSEEISFIRTHLERICSSEAEAEQKLRRMSARELAETLTDALVYEFAQKHGKHRLPAHRRAQTPPGFWRTSMPDTQELEADRSAAKEMQEKKIQERRREAMRTDGKGLWLFRDE